MSDRAHVVKRRLARNRRSLDGLQTGVVPDTRLADQCDVFRALRCILPRLQVMCQQGQMYGEQQPFIYSRTSKQTSPHKRACCGKWPQIYLPGSIR